MSKDFCVRGPGKKHVEGILHQWPLALLWRLEDVYIVFLGLYCSFGARRALTTKKIGVWVPTWF